MIEFIDTPEIFILKKCGNIVNLSVKIASLMEKFKGISMTVEPEHPQGKILPSIFVGDSPYFVSKKDFLNMLQAEGNEPRDLFDAIVKEAEEAEYFVVNNKKGVKVL